MEAGKAFGWLRLSGAAGGESGPAELIDADRAGLQGQWRRLPNDSVEVIAFDDFLRVQMRLRVAADRVQGNASAHSDAALERDSAGRQTELAREWNFAGDVVSCDEVPSRADVPSP